VELIRPLAHLSKLQVMQLGKCLPLEWTLSCLSPVEGRRGEWRHCGACNKCAERREAFRAAEMTDPTLYGNATSAAIPSATS